jgi:ribosome maturation protein SDO1
MSRQIQQPINQVRLTNVAVVRHNVHGKRFEIACYRNKVMDYRSGHESDLTEVLQSDRIFVNVSKGQFAKSADLKAAFHTTDQAVIAKMILDNPKAVLQVSDKEREQQQSDSLTRVATWMANHCVHPQTLRPYTVPQIKQALLSAGHVVQPHKPIKKQYLDAFKFLKEHKVLELERAKMEVLLSVPDDGSVMAQVQSVLDKLDPPAISIPRPAVVAAVPKKSQDKLTTSLLQLQVDPSSFRTMDELAVQLGGRLEILQQVVMAVQSGEDGTVLEAPQQQHEQWLLEEDSSSDDLSVVDSTPPQPETAPVRLDSLHIEEEDDAAAAAVDKAGERSTSDNADVSVTREEVEPEPTIAPSSRKQQRLEQKKLAKQMKRQEQQQLRKDEDSDDEELTKPQQAAATTTTTTTTVSPPTLDSSVPINVNAKSCNTCGGSFVGAAAYRAHYKSDWHRYNQTLKLKGVAPVSEKEFLLCDAESFFGKDADSDGI